jgi:flagellar L-ring protein FlgH
MKRLALVALAVTALSGCATRPEEIGKPPALSPVGTGLGRPPELYSYPQQPATPGKRYSLWNDRAQRLFTDARALAPGDILTVKIEINDRARFKNESDRDRTVGRKLGAGMDFGWNGTKQGGSFDANVNSNTSTKGSGRTERSETIELSVAAVVGDVLPNGNLVISGSQEVRVNAELRVLTIAGIVRPQDIGPNNTIPYDRIAEARISYGGRGRLTEVQQPPYGQQVLDNVLPF